MVSGDLCPRETCDGEMEVYKTVVLKEEGRRIRYFMCGTCHCKPTDNQQAIPLEFAPPQRPRGRRKTLSTDYQ